jgi:nucleotide-binding universal stress UspA family protein
MSSRLVIAYDGSSHGEDALALGHVLADVLGTSALVVGVASYPDYLMDREELEAIAAEETEPLLAAAAERLAGLDVETRSLVRDSPARALHDLAEEESPSAIVIGSSHRGPVGRVLMGSIGASLLSGAPCPIAIAPGGYAERERRRMLRIGVAYDGSHESRSALDAAVALGRRTHGSLSVLTVANPRPYGYATAFEVLSAEEYQAAEHRHKQAILDSVDELLPAEVTVEHRLLVGDPAEVLAAEAAELDLLVLGSRAYGPVRRVVLGSTSARLARGAPAPLLIIPRGAEGPRSG